MIGNIYEKYVHDHKLALDYYEKAYEKKQDQYLEKVINNLYKQDKTLVN